jgi:hypothetical protein
VSDQTALNQTNSSSTPPAQPALGDSEAHFDPLDTEGHPWRKIWLGVLAVLVLAGLALLIAFFDFLRHWLAIHTGTVYSSSNPIYYNFWSGFGSDLGEATLVGAISIGLYTGLRKVNCHTKRCWRIGHFPLEGTPYHLCAHHHPGVPTKGASLEHILEQHRKYLEAKKSAGSSTP